MKAQEHDNTKASSALGAFLNAKFRNAVQSQNYCQADKTKALRIQYALELCYGFSSVFMNFRKSFISIKFENPVVKNRKLLRELEQEYVLQGIKKICTAQGIIYRIY